MTLTKPTWMRSSTRLVMRSVAARTHSLTHSPTHSLTHAQLELEDGDATPAFLMPQSESFTMPAAPSYDPAQAQPHATAAQPLGQQAAPF